MKKITYLSLLLICFSLSVFAQMPGGGSAPKGMNMANMNFARLFGKVLDSKTKQPIEFASVALLVFDKDSAIAGVLAKSNGDFALENLSFGGFRLRVSFIGYK